MKALEHIISEIKTKVIDYILEFDNSRTEDFGVTLFMLKFDLKIDEEPLKDALNELHLERKIKVITPALGGKLVFINYNNPEIKKPQ